MPTLRPTPASESPDRVLARGSHTQNQKAARRISPWYANSRRASSSLFTPIVCDFLAVAILFQRLTIRQSKRRRTSVKHEDPESDDDVPLALNGRKLPKASETAIGEESDSDVPIERKLASEKKRIQQKGEKAAQASRKPATPKATPKTAAATKKQANGVKREPASEEKKPAAKKAAAKPVKAEPKSAQSTPAKKSTAAKPAKVVKKEESEEAEEGEEEEYRWWEDPTKGDGTVKWTTLEHNGVVFPPPYEPLPKDVKLKYDGIPVTLHPDAEEVAGFFGTMLNSTQNVENPTFQKNFFMDFKDILKKTGGAKDPKGNKVDIKEFAKCDFQPIFAYYDAKRAEKKALPPAEKKRLKAEKDAEEAPYMYCMWDGRKQKVGNFRVEPPSLFRGRGEHPKTGRVKSRVQPEQITINIGKNAPVPPPPEGHQWKEVKHDQEGTWLAMWQENINGNYKYVMLAANSDVKGQSDFKKFEKARELKHHIDRIRKDYKKNLKHELMVERQKATAVYLIDQFALRAGNEKGEDEAETVGCCSLKYENVTLKPPNKVVFDFLGKDSIRFYDEVEVDPQVFKNLKIFKKAPKKEGDEIFDRLTTSALNKHLSVYMQGLTAKVFRTYNASHTMSTLLKDMKATGNNAEKVKAYNDANRKVAILCNHKRTVGANHAGQMEKMSERIKGLRYQRWRLKQQMLDLEPNLKKKKGAKFFEMDEDIDKEWVKEHQAFLVEEQRQKITKKFEKDNEKLAAEGEKEMKASELENRLDAAKELEKKFSKENKTGKVEAEGKGPTVDKLENAIQKLEQRIETMELQAQDKEDNKEVALGTSKINYIDPRLTVVFSKKFDVPIEKFFSKALREKFDWAIKSVEGDWEF
ncbi:DNA topoisomerase 1 [Aspergillus melleus]|uniref:DNA topoisomerase 1 n=1 Tax=Aspergillus melleus TaxID=138277 RepID=UPI001E8CF1E5|nr:DNA topoisomerase 1 [Aspergillus melleus]KAH8431785.1 DNA topoisomerase 1 [Aspergillus melleus]